MNENRIQEVIEIEKQADEIYKKAVSEAERIPLQAEQKAKAIIQKARLDAETEAKEMLANAQVKEESGQILADAEKVVLKNQTLSRRNLDRAVNYVISRVLGKE